MKTKKRILLVDDDADDQLYFLDAISEISPDLECRVANNGVEALIKIQVPPPFDVIFLDLNMPIMNGFECLSNLKLLDNYRDIPVVIFTTSKNSQDIQRTKELGASLYFTKPTSFSMLCSKLKKIFEIELPTPVYEV